jgi:hypothetical protein
VTPSFSRRPLGTAWGNSSPRPPVLSGLRRHLPHASRPPLDLSKSLGTTAFLQSGAAQESNLPTAGLRRLTGFEDRLGHQPRPLRTGGYKVDIHIAIWESCSVAPCRSARRKCQGTGRGPAVADLGRGSAPPRARVVDRRAARGGQGVRCSATRWSMRSGRRRSAPGSPCSRRRCWRAVRACIVSRRCPAGSRSPTSTCRTPCMASTPSASARAAPAQLRPAPRERRPAAGHRAADGPSTSCRASTATASRAPSPGWCARHGRPTPTGCRRRSSSGPAPSRAASACRS